MTAGDVIGEEEGAAPRPVALSRATHQGAEPSQLLLGSRNPGLLAVSVLSASVCVTRSSAAKMMCGGPSATQPATAETQKIADEVRLGPGSGQQEPGPRGPGGLRDRRVQTGPGPAAGSGRGRTCGWELGLWDSGTGPCLQLLAYEGTAHLLGNTHRDRWRDEPVPKSSGRQLAVLEPRGKTRLARR